MRYEKALFKDIEAGTNIALPVKEQSYYLTNAGEIKEVQTVRIFNVIDLHENKNSKTFTAEVIEVNSMQDVQPLIFDPDTEIFKVLTEGSEEENPKKDNRKVIKG